MSLEVGRRSLITGLAALVAAPAIVKVASLMRPQPMWVWSSHQSGYSLAIDPLPATLNVGDIITIDGVERWYRIDNTPTRHLRQFVVTQKAEPGHRIVFLYPPIIGEHDPRYRTVVDLPMNKAEIRLIS